MSRATHHVASPAKVNLFLDVLRRRSDGYHDIRSVLVPLSLEDTLEIELTDGAVETTMTWSALPWCADMVPANGDNLVTRAAELLRSRTGVQAGARVHVVKRVPIGGGLGGGSGNAAAALCALNRLWCCGLDRGALMALGAELGADVPALVHGGAVCMEGIGDRVRALPMAPVETAGWWLVLVNPLFSVSTADIYARCNPSLTPDGVDISDLCFALKAGDVSGVAARLWNALEASALRKYPLLGMVAEFLSVAGAPGVLLSGSGATVFGLATSEAAADTIRESVADAMGDAVWCRVARMRPECPMV